MPKTKKPRKLKPITIAQRYYESLGFHWGKCDQQIPRKFITIDLFNAFDAIAVRKDIGIVGVQVTSRSHHAARRTKIAANPIMRDWLGCGGRIEIVSTEDGRGGDPIKREELTIEDLATE